MERALRGQLVGYPVDGSREACRFYRRVMGLQRQSRRFMRENIDPLISQLVAVLLAAMEILAHPVAQLALVARPLPHAVRAGSKVRRRVEIDADQPLVTVAILAVFRGAVPQVQER